MKSVTILKTNLQSIKMKGSANRSMKRFTCTETGKRIHPEWVDELQSQIDAFLAKGGKIKEIPIGVSAVDNGLSRKEVHEMRKPVFNAGSH
jgi:hypothetical protein